MSDSSDFRLRQRQRSSGARSGGGATSFLHNADGSGGSLGNLLHPSKMEVRMPGTGNGSNTLYRVSLSI